MGIMIGEKRDHAAIEIEDQTPPLLLSKSSPRISKSTPHFSIPIRTCPSCSHDIMFKNLQGGAMKKLVVLPAGVKFDPTDQELVGHLESKVRPDQQKLHPLIDNFIPTLHVENGIRYTDPEKLSGVSKNGQIRHFFHWSSKPYSTVKRRKVVVATNNGARSGDGGGEIRWHKTGEVRPIFVRGKLKGFKKILVLYSNYYGKPKEIEKPNWVMHQYHLIGSNDQEKKDGEFVVSKVFYQTQP